MKNTFKNMPDFLKGHAPGGEVQRLSAIVQNYLILQDTLKKGNVPDEDLLAMMNIEFIREGGPRRSVMKRLHAYYCSKRRDDERSLLEPFMVPAHKPSARAAARKLRKQKRDAR